MVTVVTADDLWVLLVGWELMGACSYFLIAHHWELAEARAGAVKAFLITRTADLGLLFAIFVLGRRFDSYRISTVMDGDHRGRTRPRRPVAAAPLLVAVAVIGKSAQVPFHTWLPDAMPGPTPISALIHAATMVAAGVFLVARMYPLFLSAPVALTVLALVAAVTMFLGALYAMFTDDLKRVLAWSTVSQLAYMFGALAAGAWSAAVLHLLAHGAFKALLFLAAGSVVHAVGGATSMDAMGGLRDKLPVTFVTMTLGFGALAGVVPLVGFFSKDAIIHAAYDQALHGRLVWPWVAWLLLASMVVTAALTVAYSMRRVAAGLLRRRTRTRPRCTTPRPRCGCRWCCWPSRRPWAASWSPSPAVLGADPASGGEPVELFHWSTAVLMTLLVLVSGAFVLWRYRRHGRDLWHRVAVPHTPVDRVWDLALVRPVRRLARHRAGRGPGRDRRVRRRGRRLRSRPRRAAPPHPERQRPGLPDGRRGRCRRDRRPRGGAVVSAWLLNGLVAVPFAFAVLTRLLARRETAAVGVAVARRRASPSAGRSWACVDALGGPGRQPTSTSPGSPSSACAGTSAWTGSAARWC